MLCFSYLLRIFSTSFCLLRHRFQSTMIYGKKIGSLVKKYMQVEPIPKRKWSGMLSVSSRSSSRGSSRSSGSDCDDWDLDYAPAGVPEGCLAVYVGPEMRRFVIQASFLYNQVFRELLKRSEEEYGFETEGGLRIPCEAEVFEKLLWQLETGGTTEKSF
ncbi:hypothetical protein KC19_1G242500 [Ceratodon purpureus]|uniref:Uncharacterized protein n=1 Tax=Ceratodon purpureus TaxID=3225 RepID=A0A8T0JB46_CERPU|nr:hypothetical protein KC19_1G242500 [Ceratodon purpureus]